MNQEIQTGSVYFAKTQVGKIIVLITNQDDVFAYCKIIEGENAGEEITLRKEHTTFAKTRKIKSI